MLLHILGGHYWRIIFYEMPADNALFDFCAVDDFSYNTYLFSDEKDYLSKAIFDYIMRRAMMMISRPCVRTRACCTAMLFFVITHIQLTHTLMIQQAFRRSGISRCFSRITVFRLRQISLMGVRGRACL